MHHRLFHFTQSIREKCSILCYPLGLMVKWGFNGVDIAMEEGLCYK